MHIPFKQISAIIVISAAVLLSGCTSSSDSAPAVATAPTYSGKLTPAAITTTNADAMGVTATEASNEAISANKGNSANPFAVEIVDNASFSEKLISITRSLLDTAIATNMPAGITLTAADLGSEFCGGSVTIPDSAFDSALLNGSFTYNNLCYNDGVSGQITINGTVVYTETSTVFTINYVNFSVTSSGVSENFNATYSCDKVAGEIDYLSCGYSSTFRGSDNNVHSIDDYTVTGSDSSGYNVSATFYHHDFGQVTISTTATLTFGACGVFPDGGEIHIVSSLGSSIDITFNSSCMYTITGFDGTASIGPITGTLQ